MIGDLIRTYRKERGLTQSDMASLLGISRNYLSMIERGEIDSDTISVGIYNRICEWTGTPNRKEQPETLAELFAEMYTAYFELAGMYGCDACMTIAATWKPRYAAITGHVLRT